MLRLWSHSRPWRRSLVLAMILLLALGTTASAAGLTARAADTDPGLAGFDTPSGPEFYTLLGPDAVDPNPDLLPACGIKVVLILDASFSINSTEQGQVRAAASGFINALLNTGSQVAIVEFATVGDVPVGYTAVTAANLSTFNNYLSSNTGDPGVQYHDNRNSVDNGDTAYTNWDYAFDLVNGLTPPDLVVFMTDGVPTARGGHDGIPLVIDTGAGALAAHLTAAEASANITKGNTGNGGDGSHIFAVGVGIVAGDVPNLYRVTDGAASVAYNAGPPTNFRQADYVIGTFDTLFADLTNIVSELCRSSLTVTKLVDEGDGQGYQPQAGWTFTGNVTVSAGAYTWLAPATVAGDGRSGVSGANGQVFFQWHPSTAGATSNITIAETMQTDYEFVDVSCTVGGAPQAVTQAATFTVTGIPREGFAACTVRNRSTRPLDFGDAPASYGTLLANNGARHWSATGAPAIFMGAVAPDYEADGIPTAGADGDDLNNVNDEDGITLDDFWGNGATPEISVVANAAACLNAWMDFTDGLVVGPDGDFLDTFGGADEWIIKNQPVSVGANPFVITLPPGGLVTPAGAAYYLRFRITPRDPEGGCAAAAAYAAGASPTGLARGGEVTDVRIDLTPTSVGLAAFTAQATAVAPALAGLAGLAGAALAAVGLRRRR